MGNDIIVNDKEGIKAIILIRALAGEETTIEFAEEEWDDLLYMEKEKVIEEYRKIKKTIH